MGDQQKQNISPEMCADKTVQMDISKIFGDTDQDFGRLLDSPGLRDFQDTARSQTAGEALTPKPPDKYKFRKSIGRGGMKMVLQVRDTDTARDVAMAVLPDAAIRPKKDLRKFVEEARITAALEHPNIVPVHEIGMDAAGAPYFTMKLLRGETLAAVLERLEQQDAEALERYTLFHLLHIFIKICNGISFAHSKGVLHMDLKPSNIQIGEFGEVLVLDWGLAKIITRKDEAALPFCQNSEQEIPFDGSTVTLDGITKGTPGYMAPEQAAGQNSKLDEKSDIYSLGAILYAILTWKNPLDPENIQDMLLRTVYGNIIPPRDRAPERDIPSALEAVVQKAMNLNPAERYNSVEELREDVNAYIGGFATNAEQATVIKKSFLFAKRNMITFISVCIIVFLLLAALIYATQENAQKKAPWISIYEQQFHGDTPVQKLPQIRSADANHYLLTPQLTDQGLMVGNGSMAVLQLPLSNELRMDLSFITEELQQPLSVFLKTPYGAGYLLELWADQQSFHRLSRIEQNGKKRLLHAVSCAATEKPEKQTWDLCWQLHNDTHRISLQSSQMQYRIFNWEDFSGKLHHPLYSLEFKTEGNNSVFLKAQRILRHAIPRNPSPLLAGQILEKAGNHSKAIEEYLSISQDYPGSEIAQKAMLAALRNVFRLEQSKAENSWATIRDQIRIRPGKTDELEYLDLMDTLYLWKNNRLQDAMTLAEKILQKNPASHVVSQMLSLKHPGLTYDDWQCLANLVKKSSSLQYLDVSGMNITTLKPLQGTFLHGLDCSYNNIKTLAGIENMELQSLNVKGNPLTLRKEDGIIDQLKQIPSLQINGKLP